MGGIRISVASVESVPLEAGLPEPPISKLQAALRQAGQLPSCYFGCIGYQIVLHKVVLSCLGGFLPASQAM